MNNGEPTYITGMHYYYLTHYMIDVGRPSYRDTDHREFYFIFVLYKKTPTAMVC